MREASRSNVVWRTASPATAPRRLVAVESVSSPSFRAAALTSGLVTPPQLEAAMAQVRAELGVQLLTPQDDELLVSVLVEQNVLNAWQAQQLRAGRTRFNLGPYRIYDSIGRGGMGQVFKAEHLMMGRTVAIKVLPKNRSTPLAVESFRREIRAQACMDHPKLVRAYDAGHDGNVYFLVTEYVPGCDLRRLVRRRVRLGMREAASIVKQIAQALDYSHKAGLIHRDVKPGNVLVSQNGEAKLSDLGLAGFLDELHGADPRAGKIVGTADFLPPEQIRNPRDVMPAGDIYSLGCTLYYAVTGKVPFPGGNTKDKLRRHCEDTPINPRHFNEELDADFLALLCDMMEKEPVLRIPTAAAVAERLEPWAKTCVSLWDDADEAPSDSSFTFPDLWSRESVADDMPDTAPAEMESPPVDQLQYSSPSQISQHTDRIAQALEETIPVGAEEPVFLAPRPWLQHAWSALRYSAILVFGLSALLILASLIRSFLPN